MAKRVSAMAVEFYKKVFKALELERREESDDSVALAHIKIGDSPMMIGNERSEHAREYAHEGKARGPRSLGGTSASVYAFVAGVDSVFQRAVATGATVRQDLQDEEWGDRMAEIQAPRPGLVYRNAPA
jgi:PhnB protein